MNLQIENSQQMNNQLDSTKVWPPTYTLKKHARAKRIRFRASLRRGLEVIVPSYFNLKNMPALLDENRDWIEKQLQAFETERFSIDSLPSEFVFQALNTRWTISYQLSEKRMKLLTGPQQELILLGNLEDKQACKRKLLSWIKKSAKAYLLPLLEGISSETGLTYKKGGVRDQSSRWGSCNRKACIQLNYKLIFLPHALVRHTLLHELCHTVHFNHSQNFWTLLEHHDPNWRENRRALRKAQTWIPAWL